MPQARIEVAKHEHGRVVGRRRPPLAEPLIELAVSPLHERRTSAASDVLHESSRVRKIRRTFDDGDDLMPTHNAVRASWPGSAGPVFGTRDSATVKPSCCTS